jgi:predicted nucleotidyltransferase
MRPAPRAARLDPEEVARAYQQVWEGAARVPEAVFFRVAGEAIEVLTAEEIPFVVAGGLASAALGRARWTHDVDLFVPHDQADPALEALGAAGFSTHRAFPEWLHKATKEGVLVDVIFRSSGDVLVDEEMLARARILEFKGLTAPFISPEDLLVVKALAHEEGQPHQWFDALGLMTRSPLDWSYVVSRARRHGTQRVLSLLLYARSADIGVPDAPLQALWKSLPQT